MVKWIRSRSLRSRRAASSSGTNPVRRGTPQMRMIGLVLFCIAASSSGGSLAQGNQVAGVQDDGTRRKESPEEVVVRGRRIGEIRAEVDAARQRAYRIFNEVNSNDEFDVRCRKESRSGSNIPQQVCRARFEDDISSDAVREYMATLSWLCQPSVNEFGGGEFLDTQKCMFSQPGVSATASAQGVESRAPLKRDQMTEEIWRVAREDDRFAQAILDFYEASLEYDAARKRRDD
jgi:hypothetical protein